MSSYGKVISTIGGRYKVYINGKTLEVKPYGVFRYKKMKPLIGDNVQVDEEKMVMEDIFDRTNSLIRPRIANLDYGVIVQSLVTPDFSSYLLDKFLSLLNSSHVKAVIILTKLDLMKDEERLKEIVNHYENLGYIVIPYSKKTMQGLDRIKEVIKGKTIAFMGQTGAGKSSLVNLLNPDFKREIGVYNEAINRGTHQTKETVFFPYENGFIADTPGFSSLELPLYKEELAIFFPGFEEHVEKCKFTNCLHLSENGCKVKEALNEGKLAKENYENYIELSAELGFRKDRY